MKSKCFDNSRLALSGLIVILLTSCLSASDDQNEKELKNAISHLIEGTPPEVVRQNLYLLERSGTTAFPILISIIDDNRSAAGSLQEARVVKQENGNGRKLYITQVGDVALPLIRSKIEGDRPGFYYSFYVLNRTNIKQWLAERSGKSLTQLRVDAAKQALEMVKKMRENSDSVDLIQMISIFEKRIIAIQNGASPNMK